VAFTKYTFTVNDADNFAALTFDVSFPISDGDAAAIADAFHDAGGIGNVSVTKSTQDDAVTSQVYPA
jgi:hypothetical protein